MSCREAALTSKDILTETEVREAGIDDWRQLVGRIRARFRTGDFATGLNLVNRIGEAAEAANHHPDITLTYSDVVVTLSSHDADGLTVRDLDLAREISRRASDLGVTADVQNLTQVELGLDTAAGERLAPFYTALLGSTLHHGEPTDASGQAPTVWWQEPGDDESTLPPPAVEQRWHLDVWVPHDDVERRLQAVQDAGGRLVSDAEAPAFWVIEDADGNRSCICSTLSR